LEGRELMPKVDWTTTKERMDEVSALIRYAGGPARETIDELIEIDTRVTSLWRRLFKAKFGKDPLDGQG
jgi:hypothetical protein